LVLHPELEVSIFSVLREVDYSALKTDYQIRFGNGQWPGHDASFLFPERLAPVCAPCLLHGSKGQDWHTLPRIAVTGPRDGWSTWAQTAQTALTGRIVQRYDIFATALNATLAGGGILLASLPMAQHLITTGDLVQLDRTIHHMQTGNWLVQPQMRPKSATDQIIAQVLRDDAAVPHSR
jgi:LysR family transcriptional regulator, glycine cleavage system transcriptional activator